MSSPAPPSVASKRWKILAAAIAASRVEHEASVRHVAKGTVKADLKDASVMRFSSFGLLTCTPENSQDEDGTQERQWYRYSCDDFPKYKPRICLITRAPTVKEMMGFNNTGNVCVWPSEEVLAYYCLQRCADFAGKRILELGAGMAGLAGFAVATCTDATEVVITDGNAESVRNLEECVAANRGHVGCTDVSSSLLVWDRSSRYANHAGRYDIIICADCLFFTDAHEDLIHIISTVLKPEGKAIIIGPTRSGTLEKFVGLANERLIVTKEMTVDPEVDKCHNKAINHPESKYDPNIHQPILLSVALPSKNTAVML